MSVYTTVYTFDPIRFVYTGVRKLAFPEEVILNSTFVPPPHETVPQTIIMWDSMMKRWYYQEWHTQPGERNIMDDVLTYADIRALEYPSMSEYVDGVVKKNDLQVSSYITACNSVKEAWPKTMLPITRREYLYRKYGMRPLSDYQDPMPSGTPL